MKGRWIGILSLLAVIGFGACENDPAEVAVLRERLNTQVETATEVEILYSDSAEVKVRITGPTMLSYLDRTEPRQEFVDGMRVDFFGPGRVITSTLVSQYAIRLEREGKVIARDSVVWSSVNGEKLETEELIWEEKRQQVYTQKFARITTPRQIIYGHGFRANQDFSNARILQVEGIVNIDEPEDF